MKTALVVLTSLCLLLLGSVLPSQAQNGSLSPAGKLFIKDAASASLMEIQLGKVAHDKGSSQEVKDFGDRMVLDHGNASDGLRTIAAQMNLKLPSQVERKHNLMIAKLSDLSGHEFDKKYMQAMVRHHLRNIALLKNAIKKVKDQDLKNWAVTTLPVLQEHLHMAKEVSLKLGRR